MTRTRAAVSSFLVIIFVATVSSLLVVPQSSAQFYFGKNKVQYTTFDWQVMTTDNFNIYFYKEEAELAKTAAQLAESSYAFLAERFNHEIPKRVPLIIYSSPSYFSQTNILPYLIPESVGGFTEFLKGRVALPFNGSYHDFAHVIRHELVHAFMLSRLDEVFTRQRRLDMGLPPLWFTEGLAEYWSTKWNARADMTVGDMMLSNRLNSIQQMYTLRGTYYMYKLGESMCHYIDSTYGSDKIPLMFENWHKAKNFPELIEITLGVTIKELSRDWVYFLKKKYYPELGERGLPHGEAQPITKERFSEKGVPIRWDNGKGARDYLVYKANRMGYSGIYMKPMHSSNKGRKTLLKGERSADFESLKLFRSGIDANDDGLIVFSSKSKERDVLYLYDLNQKRVTSRFEFDDLIEARSPRISPGSDQITFCGVRHSGYTDIYVLDIADGHYYPLTQDVFYDTDPCFSADGSAIVFSSDRCTHGPEGAMNLYSINPDNPELRQLTWGLYKDQSPDCTESGIYFSSDRDGRYNIYRLDSDGRISEHSTYATGAFDPRVTSDGKHLVYTGYQDMSFRTYKTRINEEPRVFAQEVTDDPVEWQPPQLPESASNAAVKYKTRYSLDIAQSAVGYDPVYGSLGGIQAAVSDMLGDRAIHFLLTNTARTKDEFFESFNLAVTYIDRQKRINRGLGLFHLYDEYFNRRDSYYYERQAGIVGFLSYPLSKFSRFDFTTVMRYSDRDSRFRVSDREAFLATNYLSWVYDNTIWDISGPIDGRRYHFTLGHTTNLDGMQSFSRTAIADLRHYFRLGTYSALANRTFVFTSDGREPQRVYLGGSWSFRGFDRRHWYNRNVLFSSTELRFPFLDVLTLGFPIGGVDFRGIRGALFYDTGTGSEGDIKDLVGSYGFGFRVALSQLILFRFDFARTHDYKVITSDWDFDFFFGWNF